MLTCTIVLKILICQFVRAHGKLTGHVRTIQGLPTRCPSLALTRLIGSLGISSLVDCRKLCFVNSIACMSTEDLPKRILKQRLLLETVSGLLKTWSSLASTHSAFPPISTMVSYGKNKDSFKAAAKKSFLIGQYVNLVDSCSQVQISYLPVHLGKPSQL